MMVCVHCTNDDLAHRHPLDIHICRYEFAEATCLYIASSYCQASFVIGCFSKLLSEVRRVRLMPPTLRHICEYDGSVIAAAISLSIRLSICALEYSDINTSILTST